MLHSVKKAAQINAQDSTDRAGISALLKIDDVVMTVPFIMDSDLVSIQNTLSVQKYHTHYTSAY
jgi:hypothetical protein